MPRMKQRWKSALAVCFALLAVSAISMAGEWKPSRTVEFLVTSSPGGGSDLYTRTIAEIMKKHNLVDQTIIVVNQSDGGGEVGRTRVATAQDDHLILAFMSGAIAGILQNTSLTMENFTPIAIMASDKHLMFTGEHSTYKSMQEVIDAAKKGTNVIVGGSKNDDVAVFNLLVKELGLPEDAMTYIIYDSTSEAITGLLGGHIELCIGKPASTLQYVLAGKMTPILAFSSERFSAPLDAAPTLSELGYKNVEFPLWRGIMGPGALSPEATAFYDKVMAKVSQTPEWKAYMEKSMLVPMYMDAATAKQYVTEFEAEVRTIIGQ